jgi:hypothetical protein
MESIEDIVLIVMEMVCVHIKKLKKNAKIVKVVLFANMEREKHDVNYVAVLNYVNIIKLNMVV